MKSEKTELDASNTEETIMTRTGNKLNEARFFLEKMDEHYFDYAKEILSGSSPSGAFGYYLSAFLSAARSVAWVMRSEYQAIEGWEIWFKGQVLNEQQLALLKVFNDLRIKTNKIEPIRLGNMVILDDGPAAQDREERMPSIKMEIRSADGEEKLLHSGAVSALLWTVEEFDGVDLMKPCKEYFGLLRGLVEGCEALFNKG